MRVGPWPISALDDEELGVVAQVPSALGDQDTQIGVYVGGV
jgi:hypothetical protein